MIVFINKRRIHRINVSAFVPTEAKFTYSLSGSSLFAVKSGTGEIYVAGNLDYETEPNASILLYLEGAITLLDILHGCNSVEVNLLFVN